MQNNAYRRTVTVHRIKRATVHFSVVCKQCRVVCRGVSAATQRRFVIILVDEFLAKWTSSMNRFVEKPAVKKGICMPIDNLLKDAGAQFLLRTWSAPRLICSAPDLLRAWFPQRFCKFCLKASKIRWICLISSKNLCPKYRIFALFRLAFQARFLGRG